MPNNPETAGVIESGGGLLGQDFDISELMGGFDGWIEENIKGMPSWEEEIRRESKELAEKHIGEDGKIKLEALLKELPITKKFDLMARMLVNETLGKLIPDIGKNLLGDNVVRATFEDEKNRLKNEGGAMVVSGNNLIYPTSEGFLGGLQKLMRLPSLLGKDANENQALRLVTGSTVVMPRKDAEADPGMFSINFWTQARYYLESVNPPIKLNVVSVEEAADGRKPAEDEIQVVMVEDNTASRDFEKLLALYDEGNVQWHAPRVAAAVLVRKMNEKETDQATREKNVDQVLQGIGILPFSENYADMRERLLAVGTPAEQTQPAADTVAPANPAAATSAPVEPAAPETPSVPGAQTTTQ